MRGWSLKMKRLRARAAGERHAPHAAADEERRAATAVSTMKPIQYCTFIKSPVGLTNAEEIGVPAVIVRTAVPVFSKLPGVPLLSSNNTPANWAVVLDEAGIAVTSPWRTRRSSRSSFGSWPLL